VCLYCYTQYSDARARLALDRPKTNHRAEPLPVPEQGTLFA